MKYCFRFFGSRALKWVIGTLLLLLLGFSLAGECSTYVVVDSDGSVEDYAALTVLSRLDVATANAVRIVSVHNAGWGYAASSSEIMTRFMTLLTLPNAVVTIGALQTMTEASIRSPPTNAFTSPAGSCTSSQGFPPTPAAAASRQMAFSRADVSFAFAGASNSALLSTLPLVPIERSTPTQTTYAALSQLVSSCQEEIDQIIYLQFGPPSTLASIMKQWQEESPSLLNKFFRVARLYMLDTGHAGGVDHEGMEYLLNSAILGRFRLPAQMYMRSFFTSSICFTEAKWEAFGEAAQSSSSLAVSWLYSAWEAKRRLVGSLQNSNFFEQSTPASTLLVLCAMSGPFRDNLCPYYAAPSVQLELLYTVTPTTSISDVSVSNPFNHSFSEKLSGDNVTLPYFYHANYSTSPSNAAEAASVSPQVEYTASLYSGSLFPANAISSASIRSLADTFWNTLFTLLY